MNKKTGSVVFLWISLVTALLLTGCQAAPPPEQPLIPVTVHLQWMHEAEFAGFYAADQNGYYAEEGLAVTFLPGGSGIDNLASVASGQAQFGLASAEQLILSRASGETLRAIAVVYRHTPGVFFSLADSGITHPQQFAGLTIRTPAPMAALLHAMTSFVGVTPDQYQEVNLPSDVELFLSGEAQVWGGYLTGLVVTLKNAGYDLNIIYPDDYGVHFYGDTIITTDALIASDPDLVTRFLRASLRGWSWAIENPEQIGAMVLMYNPDLNIEIENQKMSASAPLVHTGEAQIGWMEAETWAGMVTMLVEQDLLAADLDPAQLYTMQFLQTIYGESE